MNILHYIYGLHIGGAETFIANVIEKLDPDEFKFDFAIQDHDITNERISEYIRNNESTVYTIPKFPKSIISQYFCLKTILREKNYDFVHIHMNAALNMVPLILSKKHHPNPQFIIHSHNSSNNIGGQWGRWLHLANSRFLINNQTIHLACSDIAGRWMFKNKPFTQIDNAIDTNVFRFSEHHRKAIRNELGINPDAKVIGSVARFVAAKNHAFMINWFAEYSKTHDDTFMLLVGEGPLLNTIMKLCKEKNIGNKVFFTGLRTDIPQLLSAMDCFFLPSHFEGLGFTAIEAEASGLEVVASISVPSIININNHASFVSLDAPYEEWSRMTEIAIEKTRSNNRTDNPVVNSNFDLNVMIENMKDIYKKH